MTIYKGQRKKVRTRIPIASPYVTEDDVEAVANAVRNRKLSQGEIVQNFEEEFAQYLGSKFASAVMNGTAALHLAVLGVGTSTGDEVIVPSFSHISVANCVYYVGAKPVFVDIDPNTYNIDPCKIQQSISSKTRAIIVVHYGGQMADMDPILEIAEEYDLPVIEDAAEAHGASYKKCKAGTMGSVGCFSFYPNKNMTTGEGGMIVTDDEEIEEKISLLRRYGQDKMGNYNHVVIGYNYKMTDIQASLGRVQLKRLDWVLQKKREAAKYYNNLLSPIEEIQTPYIEPESTHGYMFYTVKFSKPVLRDRVRDHLSNQGIETRIAFPPIHLQPVYKSLYGYEEGYLPVTEECANKVLSLPIYPIIGKEDQKFVVDELCGGLQR